MSWNMYESSYFCSFSLQSVRFLARSAFWVSLSLFWLHSLSAQIAVKQSDKVTNNSDTTANVLTPEEIDRLWGQATEQFARQRQDILGRTDRVIDEGPFRNDWEA